MKKTIMQLEIENNGDPKVLAVTTGLRSTKKGSNIRKAMDRLVEEGIVKSINELVALKGAHLRMGTEGWQWSIVKIKDCK